MGEPAGGFRGTLDATHPNEVTEPKKKSSKRRQSGRRRRPASKRAAAPPVVETPAEPIPVPPVAAAIVEPDAEPVPEIPVVTPEIAFAARAAARPPEPERPLPTTRRAIFFDVENTSRVQHIARVIDHLAVDRLGRRTDFVAVGNWRVIGHDTARLLAGHGAQLLHSAPSVGVKDWSDLRIAVGAGVWLGTARPGDILEIISDDRAFDAVGDVATGLGVAFRRMSYRGLTGQSREMETAPVAAVEAPRADPYGGRRRRGRRGGRGGPRRETPVAAASIPSPVVQAVPAAAVASGEAHTAPHDELLGVARDLIATSPSGAVTLDALANALKARGFSRPPGSPRLITRLRRLRELAVSRSGHITLVGGERPVDDQRPEPTPAQIQAAMPVPAPLYRDDEPEKPIEPDEVDEVDGNRRVDRPLDERRAEVEAAQQRAREFQPPRTHQPAPAPTGGGERDDSQRRRRSRRGGRRHRRPSTSTAS